MLKNKRLLKKLPEKIEVERSKQSKSCKELMVMFQDGRINDPQHCWAPMGIRPNVPKQIVREYTYVFSAVCPFDGTMDSLILPFVNAETMSTFLKIISTRHPQKYILMFMDQAGWHKTRKLIIPDNIKIDWLPPYSPQCNPAEHVWDEIREKWFDNRVFNSIKKVENNLVNALNVLEKDKEKIIKMTAFDWIISNSLNAP
jgi:transposase